MSIRFNKCWYVNLIIIFLETSGNDLQNFVNIALATTASGDQVKLIRLNKIGSGFGPLIYQLEANTGFKKFKRLCEQELWKSLKQTEDLCTNMVGL